MAKAKTITRGKARAATRKASAKEPFPFVRLLDKADDLRRGLVALENAAEGALITEDGASTAINWMLEHLEREHGELVAMLREYDATCVGKAVAHA